MPEIGYTQELERNYRRIMEIACNVAFRHTLPSQIYVLIQDPETGKRFISSVEIEYTGEPPRLSRISGSSWIGERKDGGTPMRTADILLKHYPGTALVCDEEIAKELDRNSLVWFSKDHYRLVGRPEGVLELYTPYKSKNISGLPPGVYGQLFEE